MQHFWTDYIPLVAIVTAFIRTKIAPQQNAVRVNNDGAEECQIHEVDRFVNHDEYLVLR